MIIGHCGDTTDLDYLERLIANGSYLSIDRFGLDPLLSFENRVNTVVAFCEKGCVGRIVVGHDASAHDDGHNQTMHKGLLAPNHVAG